MVDMPHCLKQWKFPKPSCTAELHKKPEPFSLQGQLILFLCNIYRITVILYVTVCFSFD